MNIIRYSDFLNEATTNYYPGYADDGTAQSLSKIRLKVSKVLNDELTKAEKKVLALSDNGELEPEEGLFYQKWMYANMITTSLQDGFYINKNLMEKANKYYKEVLQSEFIKKNKKMKLNVLETMKELEKLKLHETGKFYCPGFMKAQQMNLK